MRSNLFRVTFKGIWWCRWNLCSSLIFGWIHPWVLWRGAWINQMLIENCLLAPLPLGDHADCLPTTYKISVEKHLWVQWSFQHDSKLFTIMHKSCNQHQMIWYYTCMHWFPVCQICLFSMIISWTRLSVSWAFASIIRCIASPSRFATSIKQTVNLWEGLHPWR